MLRQRHRVAMIAGTAAIVGVGALAIGPAAPWVIDRFADGQRVWRLGELHIEGVHGAWLGALRADHLSLADADGVWLEANDVELDWRPPGEEPSVVRIELTPDGAGTILVLDHARIDARVGMQAMAFWTGALTRFPLEERA